MKKLLILSLLFPLLCNAQTIDPNADVKAMGLEDEIIDTFCHIAYYGAADVNKIPALFDFMLIIEGHEPADLSLSQMKDLIRQYWDTKYSKCYCDNSNAIRGTLEFGAFYAGRKRWVFSLYNPNVIGANVNRIVWLDHRINLKGTILDYLINLSADDSNDYNINDDGSFRDLIKGYASTLKRFGAKRISDMTPEEIEQNSKL